jgi:hypothetical protein
MSQLEHECEIHGENCTGKATELVYKKTWKQRKKSLGEDLLSKKFKAQKVEAGLKVMLYNKFISL